MTIAPRTSLRRLFCFVAAFVMPLGVFAQDRLVWEDEFDLSAGTDIAFDVTVSGNTTVVVGAASTSTGVDTLVRAYDQRSGAVRWTDQMPAFPGVVTPMFLTSADNRVFVASYTSSPTCSFCSDIFVRAYDATTGQVLWDDLFDKGRDDFAQAMAASSTVVAVVGYGGNTLAPPITALDFIVRAYEPATGTILWEDQVDNGAAVDDAAWAVAIDGNRLFVAGTTSTAAGEDLLLRAYDATTGTLIWQLRRPGVFPAALTTHSGLVFVAGATDLPSAFLGAYRAKNGNLRWEDTSGTESFGDLKIQGQRLVAVGLTGRGSIVRVYSARSGVVKWQDITTPSPGFYDFYFAADVTNRAVYVTGSIGEVFGTGEFLVRGYDLATGELLLDDRSHPNSRVAGRAIVAAKKSRVFAVGATANMSDDDFLIRAYNVKDIEAPGPRTD